MRVRVLLFAGLRERLGTGALEIRVEHAATVADVVAALRSEHPLLDGQPFATALNAAYAGAAVTVQDGDELALIPPVSGG